jgi:hypothetical protein
MHDLVCGAWASQPCLLFCEFHANDFILGATGKGIITTDNNLSFFPVMDLLCLIKKCAYAAVLYSSL